MVGAAQTGREVDQARLLKDLRGQVTALETDLRERSESIEEYRLALNREYDAAHEARRLAATYTVGRDERITQVAVAWVLATVFVRFCEDNELIESPWIAGPGDRVREAEDRHNAHFQQHPEHNDRDWLITAINHLASTNETIAGLFNKAHNPLWELDPSYEAATALLAFWRRRGPDGEIVYSFADPDLDTRFLGNLYQNLSESARKTYALLQTPDFVEEFILDLTLKPAIKEFGLSPEWRYRPSKWPGPPDEMPTGLRTIDPACGSGHFLLGLFNRLVTKWQEAEPGTDPWELIRRALESVHGCDKNPFAVAIARFRLLIAALTAAKEKRLDQAPNFPINIAVGDSLLHGRGAPGTQHDLQSNGAPFTYATEDVYDFAARCDLLGVNTYHVVVGNPPYITVKDKQENENYRKAYSSCGGTYSLSVPFAQRIFELAIRAGGEDRAAGFTGQITANSFMKREFGKKLVHPFFTSVDLTHVIDTSGAYIPGHGTPTVILAGRNRFGYQNTPVRAILGVRGEPTQPEDAAYGLVWTAITNQVDRPGSESDWVSARDIDRVAFAAHPWSLTGGGAGDLTQSIGHGREVLKGRIDPPVGRAIRAGADEAYIRPLRSTLRTIVNKNVIWPLMIGEIVRDWSANVSDGILYPYAASATDDDICADLYPWRTMLSARRTFQGDMAAAGLAWWDYMQHTASAYRTPMSIVFAFVATHNHFVLDRGGKVFKQSAPVIKLRADATKDDHLALLGLLNSSTACFWLKQVSQKKGGAGNSGGGQANQPWSWSYEFTGTKLEQFPIPDDIPLELSRLLNRLATELTAEAPSTSQGETPFRAALDVMRVESQRIRSKMIALQEELDWHIYGSYGLLTPDEVARVTAADLTDAPEVQLGERAFEIVLARRVAAGEAETAWFERHRSTPIIDIPERWPDGYRRVVQARIDLIEKRNRDIGLIDRPEFKRRWMSEPWEKRERDALRTWLLDRCEQEDLWFSLRDGLKHPRTLTVSQLADQFRADEDVQSVAALYASDHLGKRDLPLAKVLEEVIKDEHVPYLAALRYKDSGLSKRADWERVWELQREEDRTGKRLDIAVPPKYAGKDFTKTSYWSHRGKLDVPKERFISYPGASPDSDDTLLLGWAGWDHKDQVQALVNLINDRTEQGGWETGRLTPLLAGLLEVMPWVRQWHGEYDAEWEGVPAEEFQAFLDAQRGKHELSEESLRAWRPSARGGKKS